MTKFYVEDNWSDTSGHFIMRYDCGYTYGNYPTIYLDNPATGYKKSYENNATNPCHLYGFLIVDNVTLRGNIITIEGYFGAYHGYDNTRANFSFGIVPSTYIDNDTEPSNKIIVTWVLSNFGWSNGSYGNYAYVKFQINSDNTITILESNPGDPAIGYTSPYDMIGMNVSVIFGYSDSWSADWNQWACAKNDSYIDLPTGESYTKELSDSINVSDSLLKRTNKYISELISLSDKGVIRKTVKIISDTAILGETLSKTISKVLDDTSGLSDYLSVKATYHREIVDTINVLDSVSKKTKRILIDEVSLKEYMGWVYPYLDPKKPIDRLIAILDTLDKIGYRLEQILDDPYIIYLIRYMAKKGRGEI